MRATPRATTILPTRPSSASSSAGAACRSRSAYAGSTPRATGWRAWGIDFPAHFLVAIEGAPACIEDMLRLVPDASPLRHEAGLVNRRLGRHRAATACPERCLSLAPAAGAAAQVRTAIAEIRTRLN